MTEENKDRQSFNCLKCRDRNWLIECSCKANCGQIIFYRNRWGRIKKFINNHYNKGKVAKVKYDGYGYLLIHAPKHHFHNKEYVFLHRWIYEYYYKVCLLPWTMIHHINGVKTDNHKKNIIAVSKAEHRTIHNMGNKYGQRDMSGRICLLCGSTTTYIQKKSKSPHWARYSDGFICNKCDSKIRNKKMVREEVLLLVE